MLTAPDIDELLRSASGTSYSRKFVRTGPSNPTLSQRGSQFCLVQRLGPSVACSQTNGAPKARQSASALQEQSFVSFIGLTTTHVELGFDALQSASLPHATFPYFRVA